MFEIRREISVDRKYNENDRTTYNVYHVRVKDCRISRQCDFDINRIDLVWQIRKTAWMIIIILYQIISMQLSNWN